MTFSYTQRDLHVEFGDDALNRLGDVMESVLGKQRCILVSTPGRREITDRVRDVLGNAVLETFDRSVPHVPVQVVNEGLESVSLHGPDCVVAVGGGSAIGLGKAIARRTEVVLVAVPTTYSGSEMTDIWGITEDGRKVTGRDPRAAPRIVVYDPRLTYSMPPNVSGPSGMNAIAHAIEALYSATADPGSSLLAVEGVRLLVDNLPVVVAAPTDALGRYDALCGAHFCGTALNSTSMGLHHKVCHVLGGLLDLPHALTHAIVLPYTIAYNASSAPDAMKLLATVLQHDDVPRALWELNRSLGITQTLDDLRVGSPDIERVSQLVTSTAYSNPAAVTVAGVQRLLEQARVGEPPQPTQFHE